MSRLVIAGGLCAAVVLSVTAAHASSLLYVADQSGASILPLDTVAQMYRPAIVVGAHPLRPVASMDGTRVYVQSADDGSIAVVDTTSASIVARIQIPSVPPVSASMSLSPDGRRLYVVPTGTSQVTIVDTATNSVLAAVVGPTGMTDPGQALVSHDGKRLIVSYRAERTIGIIDTTTGALQAQGRIPGPEGHAISAIALSPDGDTLYVGGDEGAFTAVDASTLQVRATFPTIDAVGAIAVAPDGATVYASTASGGCFVAQDVANPANNIGVGTAGHGCTDIAVSRDGRTVYTLDHDLQDHALLIAHDTASKYLDAVYVVGANAPEFDAQSLSSQAIQPETGLWWNPQQSGSGYTIEVQDGALVLVASVYNANGAPTWFFSSGAYDPLTSTYYGSLDATSNGPCLGCAYRIPTYLAGAGGNITLQFVSPTSGILYHAGGAIAVQKEVW